MNSSEIRQCFLDYFAGKGHTVVPSSSLVPGSDPSLLFTNAGMVQFKDVFLGVETRPYKRAVTAQRCVRAGGKHNDLENVGYTARHHTFFEMLGNFSFGDYFKREAIQYAWEFLTEVLKIPREKLWITVFEDDDEAASIWLDEIKVDPQRFSRCGLADNFWSMGDTGPCGPCTEIFYDHGPSIPGGPPGTPEQDGDRFIEIWNLVFMQYDRSAAGELSLLPKPSVDTGMGLERLSAVLQGVHTNYDTDLFQALLAATLTLVPGTDPEHNSLKVIADHIRSCSFLITDGVLPSNEGRGYVLRRIIRRAARHGHKLGLNEPFFYRLVQPLMLIMAKAYPELQEAHLRIESVLKQEEEQFAKTLDQGMHIFEQDIKQLSDRLIPGEILFKLYDTYGFPLDLSADIARERGYEIDIAGFERCMAKQRAQSHLASQFTAARSEKLPVDLSTEFTGYGGLEQTATIKILLNEKGEIVTELSAGQEGQVVLDSTPFYAESGGQVGDTGSLIGAGGLFKVNNTFVYGKAHIHHGVLIDGVLSVNDEVLAQVDAQRRRSIMLNHSATHLLHAALRKELGEHVLQKGSLVEPDRLRFDFAHYQPVTSTQLQAIERIVNQKIRANLLSRVEVLSLEEAKKSGAMALFGEKYSDAVRVMMFGDFSKELCGGTHVTSTGEIGFFKIISESGIAAGIRRIEAITGDAALDYMQLIEQQLFDLAQLLKVKSNDIVAKTQQLLVENKQLSKQVEHLSTHPAGSLIENLLTQAKSFDGVTVILSQLDDIDAKMLRHLFDQVKNKFKSCVVILVARKLNKINVLAGMSRDLIGKISDARDLVAAICGKGGGRQDMAQGGGDYPSDLQQRFSLLSKELETALKHVKTH